MLLQAHMGHLQALCKNSIGDTYYYNYTYRKHQAVRMLISCFAPKLPIINLHVYAEMHASQRIEHQGYMQLLRC